MNIEKAIQDGFDDIKRMKAESESAHGGPEDRLKGIEAEAREKIAAAVTEGQRVAAEIGAKAREEASATIDQGRKKLEIEIATGASSCARTSSTSRFRPPSA